MQWKPLILVSIVKSNVGINVVSLKTNKQRQKSFYFETLFGNMSLQEYDYWNQERCPETNSDCTYNLQAFHGATSASGVIVYPFSSILCCDRIWYLSTFLNQNAMDGIELSERVGDVIAQSCQDHEQACRSLPQGGRQVKHVDVSKLPSSTSDAVWSKGVLHLSECMCLNYQYSQGTCFQPGRFFMHQFLRGKQRTDFLNGSENSLRKLANPSHIPQSPVHFSSWIYAGFIFLEGFWVVWATWVNHCSFFVGPISSCNEAVSHT